MAGKARKTLRLTVRYDATGATVEASQLLGYVPVSRDPEPDAGTDAVWLTLEHAGKPFARRLPHPAIGREVFSPDGAVTRASPEAERRIVVDVPWTGEGAQVVFKGPAGGGAAGHVPKGAAAAVETPWRELGRFSPVAEGLAAQAPLAAAAPPFPVTPLFAGGPKALKLVFMAEGFRADQLNAYHAAVDGFIAKLRATAPFDGMMDTLSAVRMESTSAESGIDDPLGSPHDTWLDGTFGEGPLRRLITVDQSRATAAAAAAAGNSRFVGIVVVNTPEYGGSGGQVAVFSLDARAADIALHELGHTEFGLADEYCDAGSNLGEPAEPNVTRKPDPSSATWGPKDTQALKWRHLLTDGVTLPTTSNPDCAHPFAGPEPAGVGAFEGGKYRNCQVFRPTRDCKMRTLSADYCPVCRAAIRQKLATFR
jgi:hypothetical protein